MEHPIRPMLAEPGPTPTDGSLPYPFGRDGWGYEIKLDGNRMIALARPGQRAALFSRTGRLVTAEYPDVADALVDVAAPMVLDGEILMFDDDGRPRLQTLAGKGRMNRHEREQRLRYVPFDVLELGGVDTMRRPYVERRALLDEHVAGLGPKPIAVMSWSSDGEAMWRFVEEYRLEGLIAKPLRSTYQPGNRGPWVKIKARQRAVFRIAGFTAGEGARAGTFGALILADDDLRYRGKCGTGFNWRTEEALAAAMRKVAATDAPFDKAQLTQIRPHLGPRGVTWLRPELRATIEFTDTSRDGILLGPPAFKGMA